MSSVSAVWLAGSAYLIWRLVADAVTSTMPDMQMALPPTEDWMLGSLKPDT